MSSSNVQRVAEDFIAACQRDMEEALSHPLVITLWGPAIEGPRSNLRNGIRKALSQRHFVNISEELPKPNEGDAYLKGWEAIQGRNSDLIIILPESPGSIGELVYLTDPDLAVKTVIFCREEHRQGYLDMAIFREHDAIYDKVHYYSATEALPEILISRVEELLRIVSARKYLGFGQRQSL